MIANANDNVSPEAAEFLTLMIEETILPDGWDTPTFWLDHAQRLAQFMADQRGCIPLADAVMLLGLGGTLVEMAKRDREATASFAPVSPREARLRSATVAEDAIIVGLAEAASAEQADAVEAAGYLTSAAALLIARQHGPREALTFFRRVAENAESACRTELQ